MTVIGFRISNTDFTYAVLTGTKDSPQILDKDNVKIPEDFHRSQIMKWLYLEFQRLATKYKPNLLAYKKPESMNKMTNSITERIQHEGLLMLIAANHGIKGVFGKVKRSIAKDLSTKVDDLENVFSSTSLDYCKSECPKMKEAIWAAWSVLK